MKKIILTSLIYTILPTILYGKENSGLPQFDSSKYSQQIFWLIIVFSILYTMMHFIVIPRIRDIKNDRKGTIHRTIEKTIKKTKEIEKIEEEIANEYKNTKEKELEIENTIALKITKFSKEKNSLLEYEKKEIIEQFNSQIQNLTNMFNKDLSKNKQDFVKLILKSLNLEFDDNQLNKLIK
jgi:F0F1-type ATP synthase membrane subunit b/b'